MNIHNLYYCFCFNELQTNSYDGTITKSDSLDLQLIHIEYLKIQEFINRVQPHLNVFQEGILNIQAYVTLMRSMMDGCITFVNLTQTQRHKVFFRIEMPQLGSLILTVKKKKKNSCKTLKY